MQEECYRGEKDLEIDVLNDFKKFLKSSARFENIDVSNYYKNVLR